MKDIGGGWKRYTVSEKKPPECLWCISSRQEIYGNGLLWERIYKANLTQVKDPNLIYPGQILYIPPPKGPITKPPQDSESSTTEDEAGQ